MKLYKKFIFTTFRVNENGFCDDKNPISIFVSSKYTLKRLMEIAKYNLAYDNKIYAIQIKTIKTGKVHVVV